MKTKFRVSYTGGRGGYSETIHAADFQLFDSMGDAVSFIEELRQKRAIQIHRLAKENGVNADDIYLSDSYAAMHIDEVLVPDESEAVKWLREHGNEFKEIPMDVYRQGVEIEAWGGGPINFQAPTLPNGAWSHDPDENGVFEIKFKDGSKCAAKIVKL